MYAKIKNTTSLILSKLGFLNDEKPQFGIVLGSGLGALCDRILEPRYLPYTDIEGFAASTVEGHKGRFVAGLLSGRRVVVMQGRLHYYEGYTMDEVTLGARIMCAMGIEALIVTNAAGGVNPSFEIGDIMVIEDQINLLPNPLIGKNMDLVGVRFPDMSEPFSLRLRNLAFQAALGLGISMQRGVYVASSGPTYETQAEYRYFRIIGADACGMSTVPEVIVARHAGVPVVGFSIITNIGISSAPVVNTHHDVVLAANNGGLKLLKVIERWLEIY